MCIRDSADSILDVVTVAVCLDFLHIDHIICAPLYEGSGFTKCHHGLTAVPTPCTLRLVQSASIPMRITENKGEMITPTGAAIIAALANTFTLPQKFTIDKVGVGAGKKAFAHPHVVRAMLISEITDTHEDEICILKSAIDDSTPEPVSYTHLDVYKRQLLYRLFLFCPLTAPTAKYLLIVRDALLQQYLLPVLLRLVRDVHPDILFWNKPNRCV